MYLAEVGFHVRRARKAQGLTQAVLAARAGIARETLSQLENGMARDLGFAKVARLLGILQLELHIRDAPPSRKANYVALAAAAGSTGFREPLTTEELVRSVLSGSPAARKSPHLRRLLEDAAPSLIAALIGQLSQWADRDRVQRNLILLARKLHVPANPEWTKAG